MDKSKILVLCGPTAVGKTEYAIDLAQRFNGEIVSCDSMQLYKYMDIGSAKPTIEEQRLVKHYLVDEIDPASDFSVAKYQKLAKEAISTIVSKGKLPIIAGGTGLYLNAILYCMDFSAPPRADEYRKELFDYAQREGSDALYQRLLAVDPEGASRIHPNNVVKVVRAMEIARQGRKVGNFSQDLVPAEEYIATMICLTRNREELYDRINRRVDILMDKGLVDEVKSLLSKGLTEDNISMKGIGYKEIIGYIKGQYDCQTAGELIKKNTRHLAKRQLTWFKRYKDMQWFNISQYSSDAECLEDIYRWLTKQ